MLYIRTDMNEMIATGHVMRCLAIAEAARDLGEECIFLVADGQAVPLLESRGFPSVQLGSDWRDMEGELPQLLALIRERHAKTLLIDSYQVTEPYLETLGKAVRTAYLDDLGAFCYPVDMVICYANNWGKLGYQAVGGQGEQWDGQRILLLGPAYVPLRKAFRGFPPKRIQARTERLLILSGGTDPFHLLPALLERMEIGRYQRIDVVCGRYDDGYAGLCEKYQDKENVHISRAVPNLEDYMGQADLAVSAGGTTLYELCACGTPTISYSMADNQLGNVRQFDEDGLIAYAGDVRQGDGHAAAQGACQAGTIENILRYLDLYYEDANLRENRSARMQELVDGKGAQRIAGALKGLAAGG